MATNRSDLKYHNALITYLFAHRLEISRWAMRRRETWDADRARARYRQRMMPIYVRWVVGRSPMPSKRERDLALNYLVSWKKTAPFPAMPPHSIERTRVNAEIYDRKGRAHWQADLALSAPTYWLDVVFPWEEAYGGALAAITKAQTEAEAEGAARPPQGREKAGGPGAGPGTLTNPDPLVERFDRWLKASPLLPPRWKPVPKSELILIDFETADSDMIEVVERHDFLYRHRSKKKPYPYHIIVTDCRPHVPYYNDCGVDVVLVEHGEHIFYEQVLFQSRELMEGG